jgi:hypothetical protein
MVEIHQNRRGKWANQVFSGIALGTHGRQKARRGAYLDVQCPGGQPLRPMAGGAGLSLEDFVSGYSALIRSSAPLGQSWPYLSRYFFWAKARNELRSGV